MGTAPHVAAIGDLEETPSTSGRIVVHPTDSESLYVGSGRGDHLGVRTKAMGGRGRYKQPPDRRPLWALGLLFLVRTNGGGGWRTIVQMIRRAPQHSLRVGRISIGRTGSACNYSGGGPGEGGRMSRRDVSLTGRVRLGWEQ